MTCDEILDQVRDLRQQRGRVSSQALKRRFELDDAYLDDLKVELIEAEQVATDENGRILVWVGGETPSERTSQTTDSPGSELPASAPLAQPDRDVPVGERRHLTVMFCDLVGSTATWPRCSPIVAAAQRGPHAALSRSPLRLLVCLEEDKGADHDVLAAGSAVGRGWVEAGRVERPARDGTVGDRVVALEHRDLGGLLLGKPVPLVVGAVGEAGGLADAVIVDAVAGDVRLVGERGPGAEHEGVLAHGRHRLGEVD